MTGMYRHNLMCPGRKDKPECATCNERALLVTGHYRGRWLDDPATGESIRTYYVSPTCMDLTKLVRHEARLADVRDTAGGVQGHFQLTLHTKLVDAVL